MTYTLPLTTAPMEAKLVEALPEDDRWQFEPKWDGFRCVVFKSGNDVDLRAKSASPSRATSQMWLSACVSIQNKPSSSMANSSSSTIRRSRLKRCSFAFIRPPPASPSFVSDERFRHGTKLLRWRPDKAPKQCTFDQLKPPSPPAEVAALLRGA
jgi:hypothetical protein